MDGCSMAAARNSLTAAAVAAGCSTAALSAVSSVARYIGGLHCRLARAAQARRIYYIMYIVSTK